METIVWHTALSIETSVINRPCHIFQCLQWLGDEDMLEGCDITVADDIIFHETDLAMIKIDERGQAQLCLTAFGFKGMHRIVDVLNARLVALLYWAWKEMCSFKRIKQDRICLASSQRLKNMDYLRIQWGEYFEGVPVKIKLFSPCWVKLTQPVGLGESILSDNSVLGEAIFSAANKVSLYPEFNQWRPGIEWETFKKYGVPGVGSDVIIMIRSESALDVKQEAPLKILGWNSVLGEFMLVPQKCVLKVVP